MKKSKPSNEVFYIEKILDHKEEGNKKLFLVKWTGYGDEFNSWEPATSFLNSEEVIKRYKGLDHKRSREKSEHKDMARTERNHAKLTPISTVKSEGTRILTRQRKPTYKRSLIEKSQAEIPQPSPVNQTASPSNRSTPESSISVAEIQNGHTSLKMRTKRKNRNNGRPRKNPVSQNSRDSVASSTTTEPQCANNEMEEFTTLDKIFNDKKTEQLNRSANSSEDYPFELHKHNGLIGEEIDKDRLDQLITEMDASLECVDGYLIEEEPHNYILSRLILIAKRPSGMVAYCRLEHRTMRNFRFECVPLEILIAKYPEDVLEYLHEQIKMDALNEYRKQAQERSKLKLNGHAKLKINGL